MANHNPDQDDKLADIAKRIDHRIQNRAENQAENDTDHATLNEINESGLTDQEKAELKKAQAGMAFLYQVQQAMEHVDQEDLHDHDLMTMSVEGQSTIGNQSSADIAGFQNLESMEKLGRFEVLRVLGEGGFARVFLANDPVLKRQVALKIPKPHVLVSGESRSRFQRESQSAAMLSHPFIVPVFEAGDIGPIAYIASGYCAGTTMAEWFIEADKKVDVRTAAEIIANLAEAIGHAHQRGVIHRDLKPANVLLEEGDDSAAQRVRITDFGLARQMDSVDQTLTTDGAIVGTPAYMSPEQAQGKSELTTSTDIYSLGVMLYELLTGRRPHQRSSHLATLKAIESEEPKSPRSLNREIPVDLEAICIKCLQKDASQRYSSAHELSADLRLWLDGMPVSARRVRSWEKMVRWCQRNPALAAALFFAFMSLAVGLSMTTWKWLESDRNLSLANRETDRANREKKKAQKAEADAKSESVRATENAVRSAEALKVFKNSFLSISPSWQGNPNMSAKEVVDRGRAALNDSALDAKGQSILYDALTQAYFGVGDFKSANELAERWYQKIKSVEGDDHPETRLARVWIATTVASLGNLQDAIERLKKIVGEQNASDPDHQLIADTRHQLARCYLSNDMYQRASEQAALASKWYRDYLGEDSEFEFRSECTRAFAQLKLEQTKKARKLYERLSAYCDTELKPDDPFALQVKKLSADILIAEGKFKDAIKVSRDSLKFQRKRFEKDHPWTVSAMLDLASAYQKNGQYNSATECVEDALEIARKKFGSDDHATLRGMEIAANVYSKRGKFDQALETAKKLVAGHKRSRPSDQVRLNDRRRLLANIYVLQGNTKEAIPILVDVLEHSKKHLGDENLTTLATKQNLAVAYLRQIDHKKSVELHEEVLTALEKRFDETHPDVLATANSLAVSYMHLGQKKKAVEMQKKTLVGYEKNNGKEHPYTILAMTNLGRGYWQLQQYDDSIKILEEAIKLSRKRLPVQHFIPQSAKGALGVSYCDAGQVDKGIQMLEEVARLNRRNPRFHWVMKALRDAYLKHKKTEPFKRILQGELNVARQKLDQKSQRFSGLLMLYGKELLQVDAVSDAEKLLKECYEIRKTLDAESWSTFNAQSVLGEVLLRKGSLDEAEEALREGYRGLVERKSKIPEEVRTERLVEAVKRLIELARLQKETEAAQKWEAELKKLEKKE